MSKNNVFDYYEQIRKQELHYRKLINPQSFVPTHLAYKPIRSKIQQARINDRHKKQVSIQKQNIKIMNKLFEINNKKSSLSLKRSNTSFSLPPIILKKKSFIIPSHQNQNNIIAKKLINSKSSINVKLQIKDFYQKEKLKRNISKFQNLNQNQYGTQGKIDRKKYLAELMMLKKLRISQQTQSRVKSIFMNSPKIEKFYKDQEGYYSNR